MKKLISESRELIDESYDSGRSKHMLYADLDMGVVKMESETTREPKAGKFVVLMDNGICYILKRKDISSISFRIELYEKVTLTMKNGRTENFSVSENREVIENLIADFKG